MKQRTKGFTLIEMLLVMVIVSSILFMSGQYFSQRTDQLRIDKTVAQVQQILNAGLSYYVANGKWPDSFLCLKGDQSSSSCMVSYLPSTLEVSPFNSRYLIFGVFSGSSGPNFYVSVGVTDKESKAYWAVVQEIAGKLPLAFITSGIMITGNQVTAASPCTPTSGACEVIASVNIPGQNLNNASAVNFAGLYHHGACVPVPTCPVDSNGTTMHPQIMVVPVSVSGMNDVNSTSVYPIESFSAYASGDPAANPPACSSTGTTAPTAVACQNKGNTPASGTYWRVCLQVITEKGDVSATNDPSVTGYSASGTYPYEPWGGNVNLMAITRCAIANEPAGSDFTVFSQ